MFKGKNMHFIVESLFDQIKCVNIDLNQYSHRQNGSFSSPKQAARVINLHLAVSVLSITNNLLCSHLKWPLNNYMFNSKDLSYDANKSYK